MTTEGQGALSDEQRAGFGAQAALEAAGERNDLDAWYRNPLPQRVRELLTSGLSLELRGRGRVLSVQSALAVRSMGSGYQGDPALNPGSEVVDMKGRGRGRGRLPAQTPESTRTGTGDQAACSRTFILSSLAPVTTNSRTCFGSPSFSYVRVLKNPVRATRSPLR